MASTLSEIIEWVEGLAYWEQAAIDLVVSQEETCGSDLRTIVQYLLADYDLRAEEIERPELKYMEYALDGDDR